MPSTRPAAARLARLLPGALAVAALLVGWGCASVAPASDVAEDGAALSNEALDEACEDDNLSACFLLAYRYYLGEHGPRDLERARVMFEDNCARDEPMSCTNLGVMYGQGEGVTADDARAAELFQRACDLDESIACNSLGDLYVAGRGVGHQPAHGAALYERACHLGLGRACYNAGHARTLGFGVSADAPRAALYYDRGCGLSDGRSCHALGTLLERGQGVAEDLVEAIESYGRACELGTVEACLRGATLLDGGTRDESISRDRERAGQMLITGCSAGGLEGCVRLGKMLLEHGREVDRGRAAALYEFACEQGNGAACLGRASLRVEGAPLSTAERAALVERSCELGQPLGCTRHATWLLALDDGHDHRHRAAGALQTACAGGIARSCRRLGELLLELGEPSLAREALHRACAGGDASACSHPALVGKTR